MNLALRVSPEEFGVPVFRQSADELIEEYAHA